MFKQDVSLSSDAGLSHLALEDVADAAQSAPAAVETEISDKSWWTRVADKASEICLGCSMYILYPAILLVICTDVIGRNFFNAPLSWAIEGSGLFLIGAIFLAVPRVELDSGHILLDILYANYPRKLKLICDMFTRTFAFLWMLAATVRSSFEIPTSFSLNESGADFRYPFWPMRVIMTLAFLMLTLALFYNVYEAYRQLRNGGSKQ